MGTVDLRDFPILTQISHPDQAVPLFPSSRSGVPLFPLVPISIPPTFPTSLPPVPGNLGSLVAFHNHVTRLWQRTLRRRSQKDRMAWSNLRKLVAQWLPIPRIQHPWPNQRFAVKYPRWKPYAGKPHVRLCAGGA